MERRKGKSPSSMGMTARNWAPSLGTTADMLFQVILPFLSASAGLVLLSSWQINGHPAAPPLSGRTAEEERLPREEVR